MKYSTIVLLCFFLFSCSITQEEKEPASKLFRDISDIFSADNFEDLHVYILKNGDRETYCSMYNNNPHRSFEGFDLYLNPETGQANINCDPEISGFNILVIRDWDAEPQYYRILLVRKGDLDNEPVQKLLPDGVKEDKVYLLNYKEYDLDELEKKVRDYLPEIINLISSS
jgi:hypothetical protein